MKYYQIHFIYGAESSDFLYYARKLYSTKEIAEKEAVRLMERIRKEPYTYTPIRYEILELEVIK